VSNVTIKEVAEKAGVSIATVSRVLNNNYPVSDITRKKVLEAIKELNFQPNNIARSLRKNTTYLIGVVIPDSSNPFFIDIIRGVDKIISEEGYSLILADTEEDMEKEVNVLKKLSEKRVDAVILASSGSKNEYVKELLKRNIPVILIDRKIEGIETDLIVSDNYGGAYNLTKFLIENGHRDICIVNGNLEVSTAVERFEGFKAAMHDYSIPVYKEFILYGDFSEVKAYKEIKRMIQKGKLPTAIFTANNRMAEGVMVALQEERLQIPDDISLVTFEEIRNQKLIRPKLTYIKQDGYSMGQKAGELVINKLKNNSKIMPKEIIFVCTLVINESVRKV
jgi:LacI family transcriptional regulator